jgi:FSR family fosmidomycin resistance protein-like MFS transporter
VAVTGAPSVEHELGLSHTGYVALAFVAPLVLAAALESVIALHSDHWDRRRLVVWGQAALAGSLLVVGLTHSPWGFTLGLAVAGASSGVACGAAQALLVASQPVDKAMVRWTLFASVGDVLAPLVTSGAIASGCSYRGAMLVVAVTVAVQCALVPRIALAATEDEEAAEPLREALRRAMRCKRLWVWLFAAASCTLLDELVVALAALRLEREQHVSPALAAALVVTFSVGAIVGSLLSDRAVARFGWRAVLVWSGVLCLFALAAALGGAVGPALFFVGVTCAPHHALAFARAYESMPRNPGTVQACSQLFVAVDVLAPLALGVIADHWGLRAAMAALVLQPVIIVLCAALDRGVLRRE